MSRAALISGRAEACFEHIALTLSAPRRAAADGGYVDRDQVLTNLRAIKQKASEAEVLLRSLDHAGIAQRERRGSLPETVGSNRQPAPPFSEQLR